jgi:hypothetical protein
MVAVAVGRGVLVGTGVRVDVAVTVGVNDGSGVFVGGNRDSPNGRLAQDWSSMVNNRTTYVFRIGDLFHV